ncbi:MAG TPA: FAD-dependent monooxygenase, partial [Gemmatimonadales bacterium]
MRPPLDVLIAGAGPAGAATALRLARAGLRVLAVDRAVFPRDKVCSEYTSPEGVRHLDALGVLEALEAQGGRRVRGTTVHGPRGASLTGLFAHAGHAPFRDTGLSIPRRLLDQALVDAARRASAAIQERTSVRAVIREGGGVAGLVVQDGSGPPRELRARLTIGADGLRSVMARAIGRRRNGRLRRMALVAHLRGVRGLEDTAEMHVGAGGYVGLNPLGGGLANVALVVPAGRLDSARGRAEAFFFDVLEEFAGVAGRVDRNAVVRQVMVTGPFDAWSRDVVAPGALLVGDAADFFDPFTGEGICAALRGAELAAGTILRAMERPGPVSRDSLRPYVRARRAAFLGKWIVER